MSTNNWSFYNPVRILFGEGTLQQLTQHLPGRKGLLVTSPGFTRRGDTAIILRGLCGRDVLVMDDVSPNPGIELLERKQEQYKGHNLEYVLGIGGGSVLDAAKSLGFLLHEDNCELSLRDCLAHKETAQNKSSLPVFAVPTTAGTGSEVTCFATIWDKDNHKKRSLDTAALFPKAAFLDPELTVSLPVETTVVTGLDALSHAFESLWNKNAGLLTISHAVCAIGLVLERLPLLLENPGDVDLRSGMLTASLLGGLCISATRTALAHSISYPLTAKLELPHGLAAGFTLPAILEFNAGADDGRLAKAAFSLNYGSVEELKEGLTDLFEAVEVQKMIHQRVSSLDQLLDLVPDMFTKGRADNNLRQVSEFDIEIILAKSYGRES